jgi:hypothetical protein
VPAPIPKDLGGRDRMNPESHRFEAGASRDAPSLGVTILAWDGLIPMRIQKGPRSWMILCHYHFFEFALACVCVTNRRIVKDPRRGPESPRTWPPARGRSSVQKDLHRPAPSGGTRKRRNGRGTGITPSPASRDSIDQSAVTGHTVRVGPARGAGVQGSCRVGPMSSHGPAPR